jgi:hypothetical protein
VDDLKEALSAQYATCERVRYHVLSTMWEIEEARRWSSFLERQLTNLKQEHHVAESGLKIWMDRFQEKAVNVSGTSSHVSRKYHSLKDALSFVQSHFDSLESLTIAHGVTTEDLGVGANGNSPSNQD